MIKDYFMYLPRNNNKLNVPELDDIVIQEMIDIKPIWNIEEEVNYRRSKEPAVFFPLFISILLCNRY